MEIKNKNKIAILLSTFNGEKYLPELIDSLIKQTSKDFTVFIRDDGSNDLTYTLIQEYCKSNSNIYLIESDKNLGSKYSFLEMLKIIDSEYYMFCDQDDVWLPNKVEHTFIRMKECEKFYPNKPIVVHTDLRLVDKDLKVNATSLWDYKSTITTIPHSFSLFCHFNDVTGCTMMINLEAKNVCSSIFNLSLPKFIYHDAIISLMVAKYGGHIEALKESTILYRRHESNETDATTKHISSIKNIRRWPTIIKEQKIRYDFFKQFGYGSFTKFVFFRVLYVLIRTIKKREKSNEKEY